MKDKKLLLFDIDGTLINTAGSGRKAVEKSFEKILGVKNLFDKLPFKGRTDSFIWERGRELAGISRERFKKIKPALAREYYKILATELKLNKKAYLYPGVKEILTLTQKEKNIWTALLTGNFKKGAYIKLAHFGIARYFPTGGFGEDSLNRNRIAQKALSRAKRVFKTNFDKVYVIGDTPFDIMCAKHIKAISVVVTTGGFSYNELKKHNPDLIIETLNDTLFLELLFK